MTFIPCAGRKNFFATSIRYDYFHPGLDNIQRPCRKIVAGFIVGFAQDLIAKELEGPRAGHPFQFFHAGWIGDVWEE